MPELAPAPTQTSPQVVIHHVERLHSPGGPEASIPGAASPTPGAGAHPHGMAASWQEGGGRPLVSAAFASLLAVAQGRADGSPAAPPPLVTPVPFPTKKEVST